MDRTCVNTRLGSDNSFLSSALCRSTSRSPARNCRSSPDSSIGSTGWSIKPLSVTDVGGQSCLRAGVQAGLSYRVFSNPISPLVSRLAGTTARPTSRYTHNSTAYLP